MYRIILILAVCVSLSVAGPGYWTPISRSDATVVNEVIPFIRGAQPWITTFSTSTAARKVSKSYAYLGMIACYAHLFYTP